MNNEIFLRWFKAHNLKIASMPVAWDISFTADMLMLYHGPLQGQRWEVHITGEFEGEKRDIEVRFMTAAVNGSKPPTLFDVFDCMFNDAWTVEGCADAYELADMLGLEPDDLDDDGGFGVVRKCWYENKRQHDDLERFIGWREEFEALMLNQDRSDYVEVEIDD